jgi:hypothetical protein
MNEYPKIFKSTTGVLVPIHSKQEEEAFEKSEHRLICVLLATMIVAPLILLLTILLD